LQRYKPERWISEDEATFLCALIDTHGIDEVYESGTGNGYSACRLSETGVHVTTFDPNDKPKVWDEPELTHYQKQIDYVPRAFDTVQLEASPRNRLFFIDGDHTGDRATRDMSTISSHISPGDVVAIHDLSEKKVLKAWRRLDHSGFESFVQDTGRRIGVLIREEPKSLRELAERHGTDKAPAEHDFVAVYDALFGDIRFDAFKLLEIGVYLGRSHNMWLDWLPHASIFGIDVEAKVKKYEKARLTIDVVDQGNREQLLVYAREKGPWKVVIDDGGHMSSQQISTFEVLWDYVEPAGYYVVEDTHCSYWKEFVDTEESLMAYMLKLTDHVCTAPHYEGYVAGIAHRRAKEPLTKLQDEIEYVTFRPGILVLKKRDAA